MMLNNIFNQSFTCQMNSVKDYYVRPKTNTSIITTPVKIIPHLPVCTQQSNKRKIRISQYQYDQENLIGQGFSSKVYLGRLVGDKKNQFAIKVIDKRRIRDRQNSELLRTEMQIHKQLNHPNIVKCHEIIEQSNFYYFVMEYCPHGTLDAFIKKNQRLSEGLVIHIMEQINSAYKYLLDCEIIHRDIKPPNILKVGPIWKICDFGFSVIGKKSLVGKVNVGTPAYMAPESLERTYYSPKTDFFALGVLCYEMLFGVTPWQHKNQKTLLQMMQQQKMNQQNIDSLTNGHLSAFISKCCEIVERKRISIQEFKDFTFDKRIPLPKIPQKTGRDKGTQKKQDKQLEARTSCKSFNAGYENRKPEIKEQKKDSKPESTCASQTSRQTLNFTRLIKRQSIQDIFSGNSAVIQRQLYYCNLIYTLINNHQHLLFHDQEQKTLFLTILVKHAGYIIRRIKHSKCNYLGLKKWQEYILTDEYQFLYKQAEDLHKKIEERVASEGKRKSLNITRHINKLFDQLTYDKHLSLRTVNNLKDYVIQLLLTTLNRFEQKEKAFIQQHGWTTQALDFLLTYHGYFQFLVLTCQQSRIIATQQTYKDYKFHLSDLEECDFGYEDFLHIKSQIIEITMVK